MNHIDLSKTWGLVAYTDGGARPNPGATGAGVHGYLYEVGDDTTKVKSMRFTKELVTRHAIPTTSGYKYTDKDGKFSSNKDRECVVVKVGHFFEIAKSSSGQFTNNYAEMDAFYQTLLLAQSVGAKIFHVCADSMYVINGITQWCPGWSKNGWLNRFGEVISNADLWKAIWFKIRELREQGYKFTISHVKGHQDHPGNSHADALATVGVIKSQQSIDDSAVIWYTPKEFSEPKRDRHPLMSLKRIYFDRFGDNHVPGKYFMADPGKDDESIGKPQPETVFAVVRMIEPHPIVQAVMEKQFTVAQDFNEVMRIKVETLFTPDTFRLLRDHGSNAVIKSPRGLNVECVTEIALTQEIRPIGITMRAIDNLNILDSIFDQYTEFTDNPEAFRKTHSNCFQVHDLTEDFYSTVEKKVGKEIRVSKVLKKEFGVGHKDHSIDLTLDNPDGTTTSRKLKLKLALDLPDRNMLKQLETEDVTVELITWRESELSVRYATVICCTAGNAIWSNFYADRLILPK